MCVEVRKRGVTLTDNMYLNSYLTSINCVRGKEHNVYIFMPRRKQRSAPLG